MDKVHLGVVIELQKLISKMYSVSLRCVVAFLLLCSLWASCLDDINSAPQESSANLMTLESGQDAGDDEQPCVQISAVFDVWLADASVGSGENDDVHLAAPILPPPSPPPESV